MKFKLNKKDLQLIKLLDENSRITNKAISKKLKISSSNVAYRIENLKKNKIIENFYLLVNSFAFHPWHNRLLIKLKPGWKIQEIKDFCRKNKNIGWYMLLEGDWNFGCQIFYNNPSESLEVLREILGYLEKYVEDYTISSMVRIEKFEHNFLYENPIKEHTIYKKIPIQKLDNLDKKILSEMYHNSRTKFIDIANKLKIDYKTIANRYKKMVRQGVIIANKVKINRIKLGYDYNKVFLNLNTFNGEEISKIKKFLLKDKRILFVTEAVGWADLEFEIFIESQNEYRDFQRVFMETFGKSIKKYSTLIPIEFNWNKIIF